MGSEAKAVWGESPSFRTAAAAAAAAGIDTCGARLAQEIHSLTLSSPTLSHISLIGHSMGGLIARYALGLLANPDTGRVAGLRPVSFVSVAAPHIGCSSDHTEKVRDTDPRVIGNFSGFWNSLDNMCTVHALLFELQPCVMFHYECINQRLV